MTTLLAFIAGVVFGVFALAAALMLLSVCRRNDDTLHVEMMPTRHLHCCSRPAPLHREPAATRSPSDTPLCRSASRPQPERDRGC